VDPSLLGQVLLTHWRDGERLTIDRPSLERLAAWAEKNGDPALGGRIRELREEFTRDSLGPERRLIALARELSPALEPRFHGEIINPDALQRAAQAVTGQIRVSDAERFRFATLLRHVYSTDVLQEMALIGGRSASLTRIRDNWIGNYEIILRLRADIDGIPLIKATLNEQDDDLLARCLLLAVSDPRGCERLRADSLPNVREDVALNQHWFAELVRHGRREFTEHEDPRDGQVAALSAYLAALLLVETRAAEMNNIRVLASEEPSGFPATPGGRREDVNYTALPANNVGRHETIPRPPFPRYYPGWILLRSRPRFADSGYVFQSLVVLGITSVSFALLRLFWLDSATRIDLQMPNRLADELSGSWLEFPASVFASLHTVWVSFAPVAAIDPVSPAGWWLPLLTGTAVLVLARLGFLALLPPVTLFKPVAPPPRMPARLLIALIASVLVVVSYLPWIILLAIPIALVLGIWRR
jgi:hypothetical protein